MTERMTYETTKGREFRPCIVCRHRLGLDEVDICRTCEGLTLKQIIEKVTDNVKREIKMKRMGGGIP